MKKKMDSTIHGISNNLFNYKFNYLMQGLSNRHLNNQSILRQSKMSELIVFVSSNRNHLIGNDSFKQQLKNIYLENNEILNNYWNDSRHYSPIQREIISRVRSRMDTLNDIIKM